MTMRTSQHRVSLLPAALTLGWMLTVAESSVSPRSVGVSPSDILSGDDVVDNESFKENDDWWKDPFAMFDEDEEDDEQRDAAAFDTTKSPFDTTDENELPIFEEIVEEEEEEPSVVEEQQEPEVVSEVDALAAAGKKFLGRMLQAQAQPTVVEEEDEEEEDESQQRHKSNKRNKRASQPVNPLVETAMTSSTTMTTTSVSPQVRSIWKALPFVNLLASLAFVKLVQPILDHAAIAKRGIPSRHSLYQGDDEDDDYRRDDQDDAKSSRRATQGNDDDRQPVETAPSRTNSRSSAAVSGFGFGGSLFGRKSGKHQVEKLPPAKELMELVESLQRELDTLKLEKETIEREYEKTSWRLQETTNEMANSQSTTQYLKAQLRDNQEIMDRAVRAERRKARDELTKMKEAMLQVLQRERAELRAKMLKQTQEVQAILKERDSASSSSSQSSLVEAE